MEQVVDDRKISDGLTRLGGNCDDRWYRPSRGEHVTATIKVNNRIAGQQPDNGKILRTEWWWLVISTGGITMQTRNLQ